MDEDAEPVSLVAQAAEQMADQRRLARQAPPADGSFAGWQYPRSPADGSFADWQYPRPPPEPEPETEPDPEPETEPDPEPEPQSETPTETQVRPTPPAAVIDVDDQVREIAAGSDLLTDKFGPLNFDVSKRAFIQILTGIMGEWVAAAVAAGARVREWGLNEKRITEITDYLSSKARAARDAQSDAESRLAAAEQGDRAALNLLQNIIIILKDENNIHYSYVRGRIIRSCGRILAPGEVRVVEKELDELLLYAGGVETFIGEIDANEFMTGGKRRRGTGKKSRRRKSRKKKSRKKKSRKTRKRKSRRSINK